jgi:hypothetical protein
MRERLKRGYRLRDGAQVPTRPTTIDEIMSSPKFALGVADVRAGRGIRPDYDLWGHDNDRWNYERGRQWATLAPRDVPLKIAGKLNPRAVRLYMVSFSDIL